MGWSKYAEDNMEIRQDRWIMRDTFEKTKYYDSYFKQDKNLTDSKPKDKTK